MIKKRIVCVLIISGVMLFILFIIFTKIINNISTYNNFMGTIGMLTLMPTFIGTFIYSRRIKNDRIMLSKILIRFSIIYFIAFVLTNFIALIKGFQ